MFCSSICHLSLRKNVSSSSGTQLTSISISSMRLRCPTHPSALLPQPACSILTTCIVEQNHLDLVQSLVVLQQTRKLPTVLADRGRKGEMCNGVIFTSCKSRLCSSVCREGEGLVNIMSENFRFSTKSIFACHFLGNSSIIYKQSANMVFPFTAYSSGSSLSEGC